MVSMLLREWAHPDLELLGLPKWHTFRMQVTETQSNPRAYRVDMGQEQAMVKFAPLGKLVGGALGELRRAIEKARKHRECITIDLSEVTLVDRPTILFLVSQEGEDVVLTNCPDYLQPWVQRARKSSERRAVSPRL